MERFAVRPSSGSGWRPETREITRSGNSRGPGAELAATPRGLFLGNDGYAAALLKHRVLDLLHPLEPLEPSCCLEHVILFHPGPLHQVSEHALALGKTRSTQIEPVQISTSSGPSRHVRKTQDRNDAKPPQLQVGGKAALRERYAAP
jgi:hypothetical protein